jgi:hypothetical protein
MPPKEENLPQWKNSQAMELLKKEIEEGRVMDGMKTAMVCY